MKTEIRPGSYHCRALVERYELDSPASYGHRISEVQRSMTTVRHDTDSAHLTALDIADRTSSVQAAGPCDSVRPGRQAEGVGAYAPSESQATPGLVICPTSPREIDENWAVTWENLWAPTFPTVDLLGHAADLIEGGRLPTWDGKEGPRHRISFAAGVLAVSSTNPVRSERTLERLRHAAELDANLYAAWLLRSSDPDHEDYGKPWPDRAPTREIIEWSRDSRARMVRACLELDYRQMLSDSTRIPCMVTLTYPTDWLTVAPNGKAAKRHIEAFYMRYQRAWGHCIVCLWKLEFQRRGAPHYHLFMVPPLGRAQAGRRPKVGDGLLFRQWLSAVWADIVDHPERDQYARHARVGTNVSYEKGLDCRDPRRVVVYFVKHGGGKGGKEYQHRVPEQWQTPGDGPGRFWGYKGLQRVTYAVEVTPAIATLAGRTLRRWARAQGTTREVTVQRVDTTTGRIRYRRVRRRVRRLANGRGWVAVNDGALFGSQLARYLNQAAERAEATAPAPRQPASLTAQRSCPTPQSSPSTPPATVRP